MGDRDLLREAICAVGDDSTAGVIDEAEALARLDDLGCTARGAEEHVARWKGAS
jgi:hypothetical protein